MIGGRIRKNNKKVPMDELNGHFYLKKSEKNTKNDKKITRQLLRPAGIYIYYESF